MDGADAAAAAPVALHRVPTERWRAFRGGEALEALLGARKAGSAMLTHIAHTRGHVGFASRKGRRSVVAVLDAAPREGAALEPAARDWMVATVTGVEEQRATRALLARAPGPPPGLLVAALPEPPVQLAFSSPDVAPQIFAAATAAGPVHIWVRDAAGRGWRYAVAVDGLRDAPRRKGAGPALRAVAFDPRRGILFAVGAYDDGAAVLCRRGLHAAAGSPGRSAAEPRPLLAAGPPTFVDLPWSLQPAARGPRLAALCPDSGALLVATTAGCAVVPARGDPFLSGPSTDAASKAGADSDADAALCILSDARGGVAALTAGGILVWPHHAAHAPAQHQSQALDGFDAAALRVALLPAGRALLALVTERGLVLHCTATGRRLCAPVALPGAVSASLRRAAASTGRGVDVRWRAGAQCGVVTPIALWQLHLAPLPQLSRAIATPQGNARASAPAAATAARVAAEHAPRAESALALAPALLRAAAAASAASQAPNVPTTTAAAQAAAAADIVRAAVPVVSGAAAPLLLAAAAARAGQLGVAERAASRCLPLARSRRMGAALGAEEAALSARPLALLAGSRALALRRAARRASHRARHGEAEEAEEASRPVRAASASSDTTVTSISSAVSPSHRRPSDGSAAHPHSPGEHAWWAQRGGDSSPAPAHGPPWSHAPLQQLVVSCIGHPRRAHALCAACERSLHLRAPLAAARAAGHNASPPGPAGAYVRAVAAARAAIAASLSPTTPQVHPSLWSGGEASGVGVERAIEAQGPRAALEALVSLLVHAAQAEEEQEEAAGASGASLVPALAAVAAVAARDAAAAFPANPGRVHGAAATFERCLRALPPPAQPRRAAEAPGGEDGKEEEEEDEKDAALTAARVLLYRGAGRLHAAVAWLLARGRAAEAVRAFRAARRDAGEGGSDAAPQCPPLPDPWPVTPQPVLRAAWEALCAHAASRGDHALLATLWGEAPASASATAALASAREGLLKRGGDRALTVEDMRGPLRAALRRAGGVAAEGGGQEEMEGEMP